MPWQPADFTSDPHEPAYGGDPGDLLDALHEILEALARPDWHALAACRGHQLGTGAWFPERGASTRDAQSICESCPVREPCRDYALADVALDGIWAGTSKATRQAMRKSAA